LLGWFHLLGLLFFLSDDVSISATTLLIVEGRDVIRLEQASGNGALKNGRMTKEVLVGHLDRVGAL